MREFKLSQNVGEPVCASFAEYTHKDKTTGKGPFVLEVVWEIGKGDDRAIIRDYFVVRNTDEPGAIHGLYFWTGPHSVFPPTPQWVFEKIDAWSTHDKEQAEMACCILAQRQYNLPIINGPISPDEASR